MKINHKNNFVRIFRLPRSYPDTYCFGGGHPVNFQLIDWFNPYPTGTLGSHPDGLPSLEPDGEVELTHELRDRLNTMLCDFLKKKNYNNGSDMLAITDYGDAFIIKN